MKRIVSLVFAFTLATVSSLAQTNATDEKPEMADLLRSNGKIYVVVGVLLIILTGVVLYLLSIDKKVARLEKQNNQIPS